MADSYIQGNPDGTGKKIDCDLVTVGSNQVLRERDRIAGAGAAELLDVRSSDPAASDYGAVVRQAPPASPVISLISGVVSAGASHDFDSALITSGKTGKLEKGLLSGPDPFRFTVKTYDGASATTKGALNVNGITGEYAPPHKNYVQQAGGGGALFRVT